MKGPLKEPGLGRSRRPVWTNITVAAAGQASVSGNALVPKTPEAFTYDADGNLTSDSLWTNVWNAENRLVLTESAAGVPTGARRREAWTYLPDGRWIERVVSTHNGSSYDPAGTNRFVWDGQVLLAVLDHTNGLVMSFLRGLDLSGSMDGAGGVGGVLAVTFRSNGTHFVCYDGNGNVMALADAATGANSAMFEYGPFGEPLRVTGPAAAAMPLRFSTMYEDDVTGDRKYLFREYRPSLGRWLNRDSLEELAAGPNVYGLAGSDPINAFDPLGLQKFLFEISKGKGGWGEPAHFFKHSSASLSALSATTTLIGEGPRRGFCCNTPHKPVHADNLDGGSIIVYMTDAPKGTYEVNLDFNGSASVDASGRDQEDPFFHAGAVLKFSAASRGQVLYGRVTGPGARAQSSWAGSKSVVATVSVKGESDRVEVGRYNVQMGLDTCLGVTVTAQGSVTVTGHSKVK